VARLIEITLLVGCLSGPAAGSVIILPATQDNTLYEDTAGSVSNGAGAAMFAGLNAQRQKRRAVVSFAIGSAIPAGSSVVSATLRLYNSATNVDPRGVAVHRLLESWGEGSSDAGGTSGGAGVSSAPGDATWKHRFFPGTDWNQPGGVFNVMAAAQTTVAGPGFYEWTSPALVGDVSMFLADPSSNFGWALLGDESLASSAKRFSTHQEAIAERRPQLIIEFVPVPGTGLTVMSGIALAMFCRRRR
jgi:hypothetical protein